MQWFVQRELTAEFLIVLMSQSYLKQREVTSVALLSKAMISNVKNN
jgi:hypothetical protein